MPPILSASIRRGLVSLLAALALCPLPLAAEAREPGWAIAIHGGAGVIERGALSQGEEAAIRADLMAALDAGAGVLGRGGTSVEAVEAAVRLLEDSPHFNAGRGAVLTSAGTVELDSAIMEGGSRRAGAVTGVRTTRNPVSVARRLMAEGPHVFLGGEAADSYARARGLEQVDNRHFVTERRQRQLDDRRQRGQGAMAAPAASRMGTVGAVARDSAGRLAAATSTGGLTGKAPGRIGDAPVIGAGTLADDRCGAISATGTGEIFLRVGAAAAICARARFEGQPLDVAAEAVLAEIAELGGEGGLILMGGQGPGRFAMNAAGMYRGRADASGSREVAIYGDEGREPSPR